MAAAVAVRGLRVQRGGTLVFADLGLDVANGRVTGLVGPNGAGKSTLIRCIVGVQIVEAGSVTVLGEPAGSPSLRAPTSADAGKTDPSSCLSLLRSKAIRPDSWIHDRRTPQDSTHT